MKNLERAVGVQRTKPPPTANKVTTLSPPASDQNAALVRNQVHDNLLSPGPTGHCKVQTRSRGLVTLRSCQTASASLQRLYGL